MSDTIVEDQPGLLAGGWTLVQFKVATGSGQTITASFTTPTTAGNLIVASLGLGTPYGTTVDSVTLGGAPDHFALAVDPGGSSRRYSSQIWLDKNCAGGKTAVTASVSSPMFWDNGGMVIYEFTGGTGDLDVVSYFADNFGTSWTSHQTAGIATGPGSLYVGGMQAPSDNSVVTASAGWTLAKPPSSFTAGYLVSTDAAGAQPQFSGSTTNQGDYSGAAIVVIKAAPTAQTLPVAGSASSVSSAQGTMGLAGVLVGAAVTASHASGGPLAIVGVIAGSALTASHADGTVSAVLVVAGSSAAVASALGAVVEVMAIAAVSATASHAYGAFGGGMVLAGSARAVSSAQGAVVVAQLVKLPPKISAAVTTNAIDAVVTATSLRSAIEYGGQPDRTT